ncbi:unnamed protein product [Cercopithifilaria johnstoni]|uniref:Uncharacterized protein n=1 Tax=Cercopithifilaria johnstoni TaxID=2874296 RepID=A0A8J2QB40_9BILA|nr:unnamed protein product [Cercopithifilaria johnstoni]
MSLFFLSLDVILPYSIMLFAIWKVENVTVKWYGINLLAAYSFGSVGYYINLELEEKLKSSNDILFSMKSRVFILVYSLAQILSIPVASLNLINNKAVAVFATISYYYTNAILYLSSVIILCAAIYTACRHKSCGKNQQLKKALRPLIFYFLPITLMDFFIIVAIIGKAINIDRSVIFFRIIYTILKFRVTLLALCTVFVLPPFRKAMFNLLGIRRQQQIIVVIPLTTIHPNGERNNISLHDL